MQLSANEMLCLNSLLDGRIIPHVELYAPVCASREYIERTALRMKARGFIDSGNHLTYDGELLLRALNHYKRSHIYLVIHDLAIAFGADRLCVYIRKNHGSYHIFFQDRAEIYCQLLRKYQWLQTVDGRDELQIQKETSKNSDRQPEKETCLHILKYADDVLQMDIHMEDRDGHVNYSDRIMKDSHNIKYLEARILLWECMGLPKGGGTE